MNITEESDNYFKSMEETIKEEFIHKPADLCISMNRKNPGGSGILEQVDYCNANSGLKEKLRTTPDSHIKKISKTFRVDWGKVFKKGWLLWK